MYIQNIKTTTQTKYKQNNIKEMYDLAPYKTILLSVN